MGVHSWNPSLEIVHDRNYCFLRFADCGLHAPAALPDAQAETTDRRVRITKDVPVLRIDYISIKGMLFGVWQASHGGERDAIVENLNRCFVHKPFFPKDRSRDKL
jgi:hypothetical protein